MRTTIKKAGAAAMASLVAIALAGCVESGRDSTSAAESDCPFEPDESVDTTARVAWQPIPNGDLVVKDLGLLEACLPNAEIKWIQAPSGGEVVKYYGSDEVDLGLMGSAPATIASSKPVSDNVDLWVIWIHDVIGDAESLIVRDETDKTLADLRGKKIAVPFSSTAHYSLLQALAEEGLEPGRDVTVINLEPEQMAGAWQGNEIDAAWTWDPAQSQLLEQGGARILSSTDTAEAGRPTFDVGTVDTQFAADNPELLTMWAKLQDHAVGLIKDVPDTAAESVAVVLGIEVDEAKKLFDGLEYLTAEEQAGADYLGGKLSQDLFTTAGFLLQQGGIKAAGTKTDYAEHVDAGPAERVGG